MIRRRRYTPTQADSAPPQQESPSLPLAGHLRTSQGPCHTLGRGRWCERTADRSGPADVIFARGWRANVSTGSET
ncbi:hypothetical protein GN956_G26187 [Arapaima gigas]